jgi:RNA polymerase sigma-54 factor
MDLNQVSQPAHIHVASPQLVAANYILSLSSADLQKLIQQEVAENPAMELEEVAVCPQCGRPLQGGRCLNCLSATKEIPEKSSLDDDFTDGDNYWQRRLTSPQSDSEEFDPTTRVAAQITLAEHLTLSLQAQWDVDDAPAIEYLVGNLDENGFLHCTVEEVMDLFDIERERVEAIIHGLQAMEPIGVGARDVRECLLIQLDYLQAQGVHQPFAREVVSRFLQELSEHKYGQIALALGTTTDTIHEVSDFIRRNLNPYPARGFLGNNLTANGERTNSVTPDVIISRREVMQAEHTYDVEVVESKRFYLQLNPSYRDLYSDIGSLQPSLSDDERKHIQQYVSRAKLFMSNIQQRRQTLMKITKHIVTLQRDFLDRGVRFLRPLTRARVAADLGMHESTVSRATAAKYVMLPTGEVIPFSNFFVANLGVKDLIKDLISSEEQPLTDQELADVLKKRGIPVARRTVAKYREQLGILPSTLR